MFVKFLIYAVVFYISLNVLMVLMQNFLVFRANPQHLSLQDFGNPPYTVEQTETFDGLKLEGWLGKNPTTKPDQKLLLVLHGNAGNHQWRGDKYAPFLSDMDVLLAGYRGFGGNAGTPSEEGLYTDAQAWLEFAKRQGYKPNQIVVYGESLGTAVATHLAAENPDVAGLIVESPYDEFYHVVRLHYPWLAVPKFLLWNTFDAYQDAARLQVPILILKGTRDKTVFPKNSTDYVAALPKTIAITQQDFPVAHNEILPVGGYDTVRNFIKSLGVPSGVNR